MFVASEHDAGKTQAAAGGPLREHRLIPGNFLSEGALIIGAAINTMDPVKIPFFERDVVAFQVIDTMDGDSSRGDYAGPMPGMVRPMLNWTSQFRPANPSAGGPTA